MRIVVPLLPLLLAAAPALAQYQQPQYPQVQQPDYPAQQGFAPPPQPSQGLPPAQAAAEQQIVQLQSALRITADQAGPWNNFVNVLRSTAQITDQQFGSRYARMAQLNAPDNLAAYAQVTRVYADNNQRIAAAFRSLYGAMTPDQRQTADLMFRQQPQGQQGQPGQPR